MMQWPQLPSVPTLKLGKDLLSGCGLMKATATDAIIEIKGELNYQTAGIIYCITCKKCMMQYIGTSYTIRANAQEV